ncbi:MAG: S8 family serine peptidase, partial [Alphaproteobacteria bacterium]|nr:S8 family serine peptidase [Alphaproteobacteria bacterium]
MSAAFLLGGCGGNGVSSAPYVPPCPSFPCEAPTTQKLQTPDNAKFQEKKQAFENSREYRVMYTWGGQLFVDRHKAQIKASAAYARGATGKGEVVAVSDTFIAPNNREFLFFAEDGLRSKVTVAGPQDRDLHGILGVDHGSSVASLIAGTRDGQHIDRNMHGIAFDAALVFKQADLASDYPGQVAGRPDNLDVLTEENDKQIAARFFDMDYARAVGAGILNTSFGLTGHIDLYPEELVRAKLKHTAAALEQKGVPPADKIIVVRAAGSEGLDCFGRCARGNPRVNPTSVSWLAGLGVYFPELREHVIAVVAVGQDGLLEDYSNPCGSAKIFCLVAPGENLTAANYGLGNPRNIRSGGTSGAAALVSGSLALLRQYFRDENGARQLGSTELTARLLATADRTGTYANSDKYGHGLLDLDAATAPVGQLMTSLSTDPNAQPFDASAFAVSGNAFGGAMRDALGGVKIAAFDELDAPFFFPLADGVSHAPQISAGHSDTLHEHELSLGDAANASLALSLAAGELSAARIRRGNLWFSYGHHGGREAGLYFGENKNPPENFGMNFAAENSAENVANPARHFRAPLAFASPYLSLVRDGPGLGWSQPLRSGARLGFSLM